MSHRRARARPINIYSSFIQKICHMQCGAFFERSYSSMASFGALEEALFNMNSGQSGLIVERLIELRHSGGSFHLEDQRDAENIHRTVRSALAWPRTSAEDKQILRPFKEWLVISYPELANDPVIIRKPGLQP